ncbi:EAL domain-containing response regulator [uncultured Azohydromonas sp.]|uniref:EAL domain-containing response regulator n=1 Tax=uncultured Azohydromonas sp. TaxID=487342 RepID=UPI00260EC5F3|nr:EAL domain-containing response regulator [uncultured Azohydromonas sp.]
MSAPFDETAASVAGPGRAWLLVGNAGHAGQLAAELAAEGWEVEVLPSSVQLLLLRLYCEAAPPDVLVCSLGFQDGDAFQLMRLLAGDAHAPALFFSSRQPRAMLHSAQAMARACGLQVAGWLQQPTAQGEVAQALRAHRHATAFSARVEGPEPTARQLLALIEQGRLQTWLQPQLRIDGREVVRVEALMHAEAEDGTVLAAAKLVPALRRHHLLEAATLAQARQTCAFLARCLKEKLALCASINVPLHLLAKPGFCAALQQIVRDSGIDPSGITIEMAESDAASDLSALIETVSRYRLLGFRLCIDGFGSAHSSLLQLSQLPFSEIKIDRSLMAGLDADTGRQALVACCAGLAHGLGLRVAAEGVESEAALQAAWAAGCTEVQGALLAPPMPMEALRQWLRGQQVGPAAA